MSSTQFENIRPDGSELQNREFEGAELENREAKNTGLTNAKLQHDVSLKTLHTFGLDVKAKEFITYNSEEELQKILEEIRNRAVVLESKSDIAVSGSSNLPLLHIGEGSNLLFTKDFEGIILRSKINHITYHRIDGCPTKIEVKVGAGVNWDNLCFELAQKNIYGTENLSYIPGEVGSAAVQNIGAYGVEVSDVIKNVKTIEIETGNVRVFENSECEYGYRKSIFKSKYKGKYIVTEVTFLLSLVPVFHLDYGALKSLKELVQNTKELVQDTKGLVENTKEGIHKSSELNAMTIRNKVIEIRKSKLPELTDFGSAGSFFMNPIISKSDFVALQKDFPDVPYYELEKDSKYKVPAAWLIDKCGWKGKKYGGAQVYEKHPLILINTGNAKPEDIVGLASEIQKSVLEKFNIQIYPEVLYI